MYPPNSPLEAFLTNKENKKFMKGLNKAIEDTQMWALELWDMKEKVDLDNDEEARLKFKEIVGESESEEEVDDDEVKIVKPDKPIFALTADEAAVFFGALLKNLYEIEGIKEYKLWAKKVNGETMKTATKLDHYDKKAEEILPRDSYIGRGSGGPNIGNKIKLVSAYLLSQFNIDHNSHARTIPSNYRTVDIDFENYDDLITNPKNKRRPIKSRAEKAKKRQLEKASEEENSDEETSKTKKARTNETPRPSTPYRPSTLARQSSRPAPSSSNLLDLLRSENEVSPGTPIVDTNDESSEDESNEDINVVKPGNVIKAHQGMITTVDIFDVEVCPVNKLYRASISDGEKRSNKVIFNAKLDKRIEEELVGEGRVSTVRLEIIEILQDVLVGIMDYTKLGEGPTHVDSSFVGDTFYKSLRPRGCYTPSRMKKKQLFK